MLTLKAQQSTVSVTATEVQQKKNPVHDSAYKKSTLSYRRLRFVGAHNNAQNSGPKTASKHTGGLKSIGKRPATTFKEFKLSHSKVKRQRKCLEDLLNEERASIAQNSLSKSVFKPKGRASLMKTGN